MLSNKINKISEKILVETNIDGDPNRLNRTSKNGGSEKVKDLSIVILNILCKCYRKCS